MSDLEPYTSGYMKPPKSGQFKPGRSGNPKGRPKAVPTPYTALRKVLRRKVTVKGEDRKIRLDEALIRRLRDLALHGDRRAITLQQKILELSGVFDEQQHVSASASDAKDKFLAMVKAERDDG